ncbi:GCN5-related N-acetyltransferase 5, chloroplastic [Malania oleifera]|uniref:GCN5-related N-acetyltransferase 5, chloroplastic n=1 Tax=Malania oleifera TaxID=397392 RepID=UPI0025AE079D|nr:GCN5-related N-acetyltransferase 5, chloroplastic [Malania oleifera]
MAAAAAAISLYPQCPRRHHPQTTTHFKLQLIYPTPRFPFPLLPNKIHHYSLALSFFASPSSSSSSSASSISNFIGVPLRKGRFLSNDELEKLQFLEDFEYFHELGCGSMWVRVMRAEEMDVTIALLAESFAESMSLPLKYVPLLRFFVKKYLIERRALMPHTVTLVAFYRRGDGDGNEEHLAGTVEVSFDKRGANASPTTPTPPKNSPYISNVTVKSSLRRRGIGWHLLKASEELISQMSSSREVYLHCRMIDAAPFNMYTKAGYSVIRTDSILILLILQRRKHLMCKKLPRLNNPSEKDHLVSDGKLSL